MFNRGRSCNFAAMDSTHVFISLGSNLGDRLMFLKMARERINSTCGSLLKVSSIFETEPWGFESQTSFYNQVVMISTSIDPFSLLNTLLKIEFDLGRVRAGVGGYQSRTIDLDILYYGSLIADEQQIIVPHPRLHLRKFVLEPLCEIAPTYLHPVLKLTNEEMLKMLNDASSVRILKSSAND